MLLLNTHNNRLAWRKQVKLSYLSHVKVVLRRISQAQRHDLVAVKIILTATCHSCTSTSKSVERVSSSAVSQTCRKSCSGGTSGACLDSCGADSVSSFAWRWEIVSLTRFRCLDHLENLCNMARHALYAVLSLLLLLLGRLDLRSCRLPTGKLQLELRDPSLQPLLGFHVGASGLPLLELGQLDLLLMLLSRWQCTQRSS